MAERFYACIDLKSFYASVECAERGLDPFAVNLVVADPARGRGALCLAISPALKAQGVRNRCRLYEIPQALDYIIARPRMKLYMQYSARIYAAYLEYLSKEDLHLYSIDECFIDLTPYLRLYQLAPKVLVQRLMAMVHERFHICAHAGVGTNLFLAKVALDVLAKHVPDNIAYLDEQSFRERLWHHRPLTDIWNIGRGITRRLARYGVYDLYGVTRLEPALLYKEFGVNARFLIDHAWGIEPCTLSDIHNYRPSTHSLSNGQILFEDYDFSQALIVLREMVELLSLELVERRLTAAGIALSVGYSDERRPATGGTRRLPQRTASLRLLEGAFERLYAETTSRQLPIRRVNVSVTEVQDERLTELGLFDAADDGKEKQCQLALLEIKQRFGKNAILRGTSLQEKATGRLRNKLIGGHNSE